MMASTHVAIGVVIYGGACAFAGAPIEPAALGCAGVGALLPDVDTPNSRAGFCVYPLALYLERKFGHRTVTHSFVGTTIFAALCLPLFFWPHLHPFYWALLIGYASCARADMLREGARRKRRSQCPGRARFGVWALRTEGVEGGHWSARATMAPELSHNSARRGQTARACRRAALGRRHARFGCPHARPVTWRRAIPAACGRKRPRRMGASPATQTARNRRAHFSE